MEHLTEIRAMVSLRSLPLYGLAVRSHNCPKFTIPRMKANI